MLYQISFKNVLDFNKIKKYRLSIFVFKNNTKKWQIKNWIKNYFNKKYMFLKNN